MADIHERKAMCLLFIVSISYCTAVKGSNYQDVFRVTVELVEGEQGDLPCIEGRRTDSAFWWRTDVGLNEILVELDLIPGKSVRSGQGFEDGLYTISDNYSLIIKQVKPEDEGVYQCQAIDHVNDIVYIKTAIASVHSKGTDLGVSRGNVLTYESVELTEGERGVLPCKVNRNVAIVRWSRAADPPGYVLAKLHLYSKPVVRSGQGYGAGSFDITDDFSLIIKHATLEDEMLYTCYATGYGLDVQYYNSTQVYVYAKGIRKGTSSKEAPVETASTQIPLKTGHPAVMYGHSTERAVSTDTLSTQSTKHSGCKRDIYGVSAVLFGFFVVAMVLSLCMIYWLWRRRT